MIINKALKLLLLLIFVTFALFVSGCTEKDLSAEEIATQMLEKQDSIQDYSYTMHTTYYVGEKAIESEFKTIYKKPHMIKNFIQEPGKKEETLVLSDEEFRWTYAPDTNTVMKTKLPKTPELAKNDYIQLIDGCLNDTNVTLLGVESLDNRTTYLLETAPKITPEEPTEDYQMVGRTKIWVDKEKWMPLRYEMYNSDGNLTIKIEIRDLKINSGIPDSEFVFNIPDGAKITTMDLEDFKPPEELSLEEAGEQASFEILTPEYLPEGYTFNHSTVYNNSEFVPDGQTAETVILTYIKEEASIILAETLYEGQLPDNAVIDTGEDIQVNGTEGKYLSLGEMKTLKWKSGNIDLTLSASLEKNEMLKIAESVSVKEENSKLV